ncbi:oligosaccharide flippase family protein [Pseudomonas sp. MBLB4136]|uniref:oligosaccharide flippase family protein n=1 Tax=Pseudomonas sp. MBLB4136 TaxID=3451558 RepID=UPI003F757027
MSVVYSLLSKFVGIFVALVTMPLTSEYFGGELFGVWMMVTGLLATLTFVDLGIGTGLQNGISKSFGLDDPKISEKYIVNAYLTASLVAVLLMITLSICLEVIRAEDVVAISSSPALSLETINALYFGLCVYLVGVPASLVHRVLNGYQENSTTNKLIICGNVTGFIGICASVYLDLGFSGVLFFFAASPVVINSIYSIYYFHNKRGFFLRRNLDREVISKLFTDGGWSLLAQVMFAVKLNSPPVIIGVVVGAVAVGEYGVAQKSVSVLGVLVAVALQPLWSAYGEAYYRKDKIWILKALKKSILFVLIVTLPSSLFFMFFGQDLIGYWIKDVVPSVALIAALSGWVVLSNLNVCFAMFLNGIGAFKRQSLISVLFMLGALWVSYYSGLAWSEAGVVIGFVLVAELARMPFLANEVRREFRGIAA